MIKRSIQQEDITFVNIYEPRGETSKNIKQILTEIQGERESNTIIVGNFNTPLTSLNRSFRQKINKETLALNDTLDQMDLTDIYPKAAGYTFFSSAHGSFTRIFHMLSHKMSLDTFKKTEITSSIFSDHNSMKLEIKYKKKTGKNTNMWRLNNMLLNNQWINEEIKEEIKKYLEPKKMKPQLSKIYGMQEKRLGGKFTVLKVYLKK